MSVSASFKAYVLEQLADPKRIKARAMFGGVGLYWEGAFFAVIEIEKQIRLGLKRG